VERLQNFPEILPSMSGKKVYVTVKEDGTSFTSYSKDLLFGVCSRKLDLLETEDNTYWKMARKYDLENIFKRVGKNVSIQAEVTGPGIQKNKLGRTELQLGVFDVFDIDNQRYFDYDDQVSFCKTYGLPRVKDYYVGIWKDEWKTLEDLLKIANELMYDNGTPAEGLVFRTCVEETSDLIKQCRSRLAFKVVSNVFLEKYGE
jgi:RNA ligase (TIGR02306 family)